MSDFKYPIRFSTWHVIQTHKNPKVKKPVNRYVVEDIMVAAMYKHIPVLMETDFYLRKVYRKIYGKSATFTKAWEEKRLRVVKVELSDHILGRGKGCFKHATLVKHGFEKEEQIWS